VLVNGVSLMQFKYVGVVTDRSWVEASGREGEVWPYHCQERPRIFSDEVPMAKWKICKDVSTGQIGYARPTRHS